MWGGRYGGRNVTLTLPDGRRATFRFAPEPNGLGQYVARWQAPPGVQATLGLLETGPDSDVIQVWPVLHWKTGGPYTTFENYDLPCLVLTTADGTQYVIERDALGPRFALDEDGNDVVVDTYGAARLSKGSTLVLTGAEVAVSVGLMPRKRQVRGPSCGRVETGER